MAWQNFLSCAGLFYIAFKKDMENNNNTGQNITLICEEKVKIMKRKVGLARYNFTYGSSEINET